MASMKAFGDLFWMGDTSKLGGHFLKLKKKEGTRFDLRKFTFSQRVVDMMSDLSAGVVTTPTA